jgi:hypothetical protein
MRLICVDEKIILKLIFEKEREDVECIHLAQNRIQCRVIVNSVMKLQYP